MPSNSTASHRYRIFIFLVFLTSALVSCYYIKPQSMVPFRGPLHGRKIMLDPGHGVKNAAGNYINRGMKSACGVMEDEVVIEIAELLGQRLRDAGCEVYYTRNKENFWRIYEDARGDNYNRAFEARERGVDAFVKLHTDWYRNKKTSGVSTFYFKQNSRMLAHCMQQHLVRFIRRPNREVKQEWYVGMEVADMPTVLVEMCFLSNPAEARLLSNQVFLDECAEGLYQGIIQYFLSPEFEQKKKNDSFELVAKKYAAAIALKTLSVFTKS